MHLEVPLTLAPRQDREVPDKGLAVESAHDVPADLDLGVRHLLLEVRGTVVLAGTVDLLDRGEQVGPGGNVAGRQRSQGDVHRVRVVPRRPRIAPPGGAQRANVGGRGTLTRGTSLHAVFWQPVAGCRPWWLRAASSTRSAVAATEPW